MQFTVTASHKDAASVAHLEAKTLAHATSQALAIVRDREKTDETWRLGVITVTDSEGKVWHRWGI